MFKKRTKPLLLSISEAKKKAESDKVFLSAPMKLANTMHTKMFTVS